MRLSMVCAALVCAVTAPARAADASALASARAWRREATSVESWTEEASARDAAWAMASSRVSVLAGTLGVGAAGLL